MTMFANGAVVAHAAGRIADLSAKTIAAGQARVAAFGQDKLGERADEAGFRAVATAQADLCQRAVERWLELCYERNGSVWFNLRSTDGMIRLAPPWSRTRRVNYHLTDPQARLLRLVVLEVLGALPLHRKPYFYDPAPQRWYLNRQRFPTVDAALDWQRGLGAITPSMWRKMQERAPGGRLRGEPEG